VLVEESDHGLLGRFRVLALEVVARAAEWEQLGRTVSGRRLLGRFARITRSHVFWDAEGKTAQDVQPIGEEKEPCMEHSDQLQQPNAVDSERPNGEAPLHPGGYHSRGVPGEEGELRNQMRVLKVGDRSPRITKS